jgi:triosephosphate isomerase
VSDKVQFALSAGLKVILCIGEDLATREAGNTVTKVISQLEAVKIKEEDWANIVVA